MNQIKRNFFGRWECGFQEILEQLNNSNQYKKLTHEYSIEKIPFLDLKVGSKDGKNATKFHVKPTDNHQYLHFLAAQPNHPKLSSQTLHKSRLCSNKCDFERNKEKMRSWFVKREYPQKLIVWK